MVEKKEFIEKITAALTLSRAYIHVIEKYDAFIDTITVENITILREDEECEDMIVEFLKCINFINTLL